MKRYCKWLALAQCMIALLLCSGRPSAHTLQVTGVAVSGNSTLVSYQARGMASTALDIYHTTCQFPGMKCRFQVIIPKSQGGIFPAELNLYMPQYVELNSNTYYSWEQIGNLYIEKYGAKSDFKIPIATTQCLKFGVYDGRNPPRYMPNSECNAPTTVMVLCDFTAEVENIDHGTLSPDSIVDNIKSITVESKCTGGNAKVVVHATDDTGVTMKNGEIKSVLTVDDKVLGSVIDVPEGTSTHTLTSKLTVLKTVTAGDFSASTVLTITVQ